VNQTLVKYFLVKNDFQMIKIKRYLLAFFSFLLLSKSKPFQKSTFSKKFISKYISNFFNLLH